MVIKLEHLLKETGTGWNAHGMHNIDPHQLDNGQWIACVDGYQKRLIYGLTIKIKLQKAWRRLLSGIIRDLKKMIKIVR